MSSIAPDRLVTCFESLGHLCEFGVVQSFCGAEPLGLFRFATIPHEHLITLLRTDFAALDDPREISVFLRPGEDEWIGRIARYDIEYHTSASCRDIAKADFLPKERKRVAFLTRKLRQQIATPDKIFLRRDWPRTASEMGALFDALQAAAPHKLLWVDRTNGAEETGRISTLRPGLLRAGYGHFWPDAAPSPAGLGLWLRLLDDALRLFDPPAWERLQQESAPVTHSDRAPGWFSAAGASAMPAPHLTAPNAAGPVVAHVLVADATLDEPIFACEASGFPAESIHVVSAWVWIPRAFDGWVGLMFPGVKWIRMWQADLAQRDCWQRIVTNARLPQDYRGRPGIVAKAIQGQIFYSAGWAFERGAVPVDCLVSQKPDRLAADQVPE